MALEKLKKAREVARRAKQQLRAFRIESLFRKNIDLPLVVSNPSVMKILLAVLYAAEGSRNPRRSAIMFGNSDPLIIRIFLYLLRGAHEIDERKFRCTIQCRADQDAKNLQVYWSRETGIPESQFYKPRIDPRSIGKPSKNRNYKGVCRIDYFSSMVLAEINVILELLDRKILQENTRAHSSVG